MEYSSETMVELSLKTENLGNSRDKNPVGLVFLYGVWMDNELRKHVTGRNHPVLAPS